MTGRRNTHSVLVSSSLPNTGPGALPVFRLATAPQGQCKFLLHCLQPTGYTFSSEPQLVNYGVWAESSLPSIFANQVLLGHYYDRLFMYFLWLLKATINGVVTTEIYGPQS